jgi:hypothetical protein
VSDENIPFDPSNNYPLVLIATQYNKRVVVGIGMNEIGWKRYSNSINFGSFLVGVPISFSIAKASGSGVGDPTPNTIIYDARNLEVSVAVTCA